MDIFVFCIVLFAAMLHASWNAIVKSGGNKFTTMTWLVIGQMFCGFITLFFVPLASFLESISQWWPFFVSSLFFHLGYQIFLAYSYKHGDMSDVYPLARGIAPLLVTAFMVGAQLEYLTWLELTGIAFVGGGILSLGIKHKTVSAPKNNNITLFAFITGLFIAAYSISDATGAKISDEPLAFFATIAVIDGVFMVAFMMFFRRDDMQYFWHKRATVDLSGGVISFTAYGLIMWTFTQAPISLVTALRETSILFALLIGVFFLKERLTTRKLIAIFLIFIGTVLAKL